MKEGLKNQMEKYNIHQINISAPNLIVICIDKADTEEIEGRFYHCYGNEPVSFVSIVEFLTKAEKFFDLISFPQASTRTRNFDSKIRNDKIYNNHRPKKVVEQTEIIQRRGEKATFVVWVKFRQNSTWQGEMFWMEEGEKKIFGNVLELTSEIDKTLQKQKIN